MLKVVTLMGNEENIVKQETYNHLSKKYQEVEEGGKFKPLIK